MGERGQIKIKDTGVYLYTHWGGNELKEMLKKALIKRWRWSDEEYLTRIIFDVMTEGQQGEETGAGIGTQEHSDLNYALIVVDVAEQTIKEEKVSWTFEEFIDAKL